MVPPREGWEDLQAASSARVRATATSPSAGRHTLGAIGVVGRRNSREHALAFREVFIVETGRGYSATLHGKRIPMRRRKSG